MDSARKRETIATTTITKYHSVFNIMNAWIQRILEPTMKQPRKIKKKIKKKKKQPKQRDLILMYYVVWNMDV